MPYIHSAFIVNTQLTSCLNVSQSQNVSKMKSEDSGKVPPIYFSALLCSPAPPMLTGKEKV